MMGLSMLTTKTEDRTSELPKRYVIMFHANYHGACKAMSPKVMELQSQVDADQVQFIMMDLTSTESKEKSAIKAKELGLEKIFKSKKGSGFVVLVDAQSKKQKAVLTRKQTSDDMLNAVQKFL